jgi:hypothetical protein
VVGINVTVAVAVAEELAWLVAVSVTVCCVVMLAGAVYRPEELMLPTPPGVIVQFTVVLLVLVTVAVNCCV